MLTELLAWAGVPGKILLLVSFAFGAYHLRSLFGVAAVAGTWIQMALVFAFVFVVGVTGVVPGFEVHIDVGVLLEHAKWALRFVPF